MTTARDDIELDRLADDGCPNAPDPGRPARRTRRLAAALVAAVVASGGCRALRDDHPSGMIPPTVSLTPGVPPG